MTLKIKNKKTIKKAIYIFLLALLSSCSLLKQPVVFEVGKDLTKQVLADLLNVNVNALEKDSVNIEGNFARDRVAKILGKNLQAKFTPKGVFYFENEIVRTQLNWEVALDSVQVHIHFNRIKK